MSELEVQGEVLAEEDVEAGPEQPVRAIEAYRAAGSPVLRTEVRTAALAAAGGVLAGAATVAAVRAVGAVASRGSSAAPSAPPQGPAADQRRRQPLVPGRRSPPGSLSARAVGPRNRGDARLAVPDAALRRRGPGDADLRAESRPGSSTSAAARSWSGPGSSEARRVVLRAEPVDPAAVPHRLPPLAAPAAHRRRRGPAAGDRADALRPRRRRGPRRVLPRASAATPCSARSCAAVRTAVPTAAPGPGRRSPGRSSSS